VELKQNNESDKLLLNLDPRTKIILMVIISFTCFNVSPSYLSSLLILIPFFCFLTSKYKKITILCIFLYTIAWYIQMFIIPTATGLASVIFVAFCYMIMKLLPILMMGFYTILTTKVSEFISAMEKSNIPKDIIIPLSVIFRYIPTLFEEIKLITDAMKMRGFGLTIKSIKSPLKLIEFYLIPILISAIKTSDELSAASLTRGLSNPEKRTHLVTVGFKKIDFLFLAVSIVGFGSFVYNFLGGVF